MLITTEKLKNAVRLWKERKMGQKKIVIETACVCVWNSFQKYNENASKCETNISFRYVNKCTTIVLKRAKY